MLNYTLDQAFEFEYFANGDLTIGDRKIRSLADIAELGRCGNDEEVEQARKMHSLFMLARETMRRTICMRLDLRSSDRIYHTDEGIFIKRPKKTLGRISETETYEPDFEQLGAVADLLKELK